MAVTNRAGGVCGFFGKLRETGLLLCSEKFAQRIRRSLPRVFKNAQGGAVGSQLRRIVLGTLFAFFAMTFASPVAAQTSTVWSMLGIGADQQSSDPAIQAAAKAKAAKHKICKKKKALQYLAGMGCTPEHPEVGPALIAAMSDPDEPVRYEAVKAVLQTASSCQSNKEKRASAKAKGCSAAFCDLKKKIEKKFCDCLERLCGKLPPKEHKKLKDKLKLKRNECENDPKADCPGGNGQGPCCSPEMRAKLTELAYGRDEKGCFLETSTRVRTMAEQALNACQSCSGGACNGAGVTGLREMAPPEEFETLGGDTGDCEPSYRVIPNPAPPADQFEVIPLPVPASKPTAPQARLPVLNRGPDRGPDTTVAETSDSQPGQPALSPSRAWKDLLPARKVFPAPSVSIVSPPKKTKSSGPRLIEWPTIEIFLAGDTSGSRWLPELLAFDSAAEAGRMIGEPLSSEIVSASFPIAPLSDNRVCRKTPYVDRSTSSRAAVGEKSKNSRGIGMLAAACGIVIGMLAIAVASAGRHKPVSQNRTSLHVIQSIPMSRTVQATRLYRGGAVTEVFVKLPMVANGPRAVKSLRRAA